MRQLRLRPKQAERLLPALEHSGDGCRITACNRDLAAHGAEPVHSVDAHEVELATGGACTGGAIWPPCTMLRRTARSKEVGAPSDFAFPFA